MHTIKYKCSQVFTVHNAIYSMFLHVCYYVMNMLSRCTHLPRHMNFYWRTNNSDPLETKSIQEITDKLCALYNSGGGVLYLCRNRSQHKNERQKSFKKDIKRVEEQLKRTIPPIETGHYLASDPPESFDEDKPRQDEVPVYQFIVKTKDNKHRIPGHRLHLKVPRLESIDNPTENELRQILLKEPLDDANDCIPDPPTRETIKNGESDRLQFKGATNSIQLESCIKRHLRNYLSAFGSFWGGSVVFGVEEKSKDNTISCTGVSLKGNLEKRKREIKEEVQAEINRMWVGNESEAKYELSEGKDFSVTFDPITEEDLCTFLVIVSIRSLRSEFQGVYQQKPQPITCQPIGESFELAPVSFVKWSKQG